MHSTSGRLRSLAVVCLAGSLVLLAAPVGAVTAPASAHARVSTTEDPAPAVPASPAPPVLTATSIQDSTAPMPSERGLRSALGSLLRTPALGRASVVIVDPGTNAVLLGRNAETPRIPASTIKLLTGVAAVRTLGPNTRLATRVVRDGDTIILVGGGDATLVSGSGGRGPLAGGSASLRELARQTARAVGGGPVRLGFDDSLFTGPTLGPGWSRGFPSAGVVAPVTALMVDQGRRSKGSIARVADPARQAARIFAQYLEEDGVRVQRVRRMKAPVNASEVARVESPPVAELVQRMLTESDNDLAESLAHLVGREAGTGASFAGGGAAVMAVIDDLGLPDDGLRIVDGSGLSQENKVASITLAGVLVGAARRSDSVFGPIASGLPVAGETGTLADRFRGRGAAIARGNVRAKTGTLSSVVGLAGTVKDADGRVLVFAVLGNRVPSVEGARRTVDEIAVRLAECGCS